jgi:nucleotide-binding universal stress UspA family protein/predicted transcriptional regulator
MAFPFRRILSPVDFDENSLAALAVAAQVAAESQGTIFLLHVVPMIIPPAGMPLYVDVYKDQEKVAKEKLTKIAADRLKGVKHEIVTGLADPAGAILKTARKVAADVIVMATHGRRGLSHVLLGSVAERVVREAPCPVLTVRQAGEAENLVGKWMSKSPVTANPDEKLSTVEARMRQGGFRCVPVIDKGKVVGVVTDRDLRSHTGYTDHTEVRLAMSEAVLTVTPDTTIGEAAQLLLEQKIGGLPVVEDDRLVGIITTSDILKAFAQKS